MQDLRQIANIVSWLLEIAKTRPDVFATGGHDTLRT
jgi:hypothetical protein